MEVGGYVGNKKKMKYKKLDDEDMITAFAT